MTIDTKRMKANGESSNDTMTLQRVSGGPGLAGKWKTKNVKISAPGTMDDYCQRIRRPEAELCG